MDYWNGILYHWNVVFSTKELKIYPYYMKSAQRALPHVPNAFLSPIMFPMKVLTTGETLLPMLYSYFYTLVVCSYLPTGQMCYRHGQLNLNSACRQLELQSVADLR